VPAGDPEPEMLDVRDDLLEQLGDMVVVQLIDDATAVAQPDDEPQVPQHPQLVRDGGSLHPDAVGDVGDVGDRGGTRMQPR